ncbi:MAG: hypothetical protein WDN48_04335 [Pseudolabrys sp.]
MNEPSLNREDLIAEISGGSDGGRGLFINVVFFVDPLKNFAQGGLVGEMPDLDKLSKMSERG